MTPEQKAILLKTAKDAVAAAVNKTPVAAPACDDPELNERQGCFVTLKNGERLRGCIGQFTSDKPLINLISEMGVSSSTHDPRFFTDPITPGELDSLDIEISVLSPMIKTDDPSSLRLGVDGIYIVKGARSGCFLPQVATETGWTVEEFLSYCCAHKAGLEPDAWRNPDTEVFLFTADAFDASFADI
jgi:AmmeMemoRadiSam system protein A